MQQLPLTNTIYTIGHSTRTWEDFCESLTCHNIAVVADIRSFPGSRRYPQFKQETMRVALPARGITYRHLPLLGGRRHGRPDSPNTRWRNQSFRSYADYMETADFRQGIDQLTSLARCQRVAYMCSEAVWWRCHRSMVSDYLLATGWRVLHIMDGALTPHTYTQPARLFDGQLSYHEVS